MCPHNEVKTIAARSGEWWWCENCGGLRDPQGRWFKSRQVARVAVSRAEKPNTAGGIVRAPSQPGQVVPKIDPMTPQADAEDA